MARRACPGTSRLPTRRPFGAAGGALWTCPRLVSVSASRLPTIGAAVGRAGHGGGAMSPANRNAGAVAALIGAVPVLIAIFQQSEAIALLWALFVLLILVAAALFAWPLLLRAVSRVRRRLCPKLAITPTVDFLSYAYPDRYHHSVVGGFISEERKYAALLVRNTSAGGLDGVVARCILVGQGVELPCFWSAKPGPKFEAGEGYSVDLPVDHERVLVIAQAFGKDKEWARLPADLEHFFDPTGPSGDGKRWSPAREHLNLGRSVQLEVRFKASGLNQKEQLLLDFDADGSTVERLTPPADPPPTKSGS